MNVKEFTDDLEYIKSKLKPCPLCNGKADIVGAHSTVNVGVHSTVKNIIIDAVGCPKCNLTVERELYRMENPKRLFSKRTKSVVDVVYTWNNRRSN